MGFEAIDAGAFGQVAVVKATAVDCYAAHGWELLGVVTTDGTEPDYVMGRARESVVVELSERVRELEAKLKASEKATRARRRR